MITGNYSVSLQTPMGLEKGTLTLNEVNGKLTGTLKAMGSSTPIINGTADGNHFSFSGMVRKLFMSIDYRASGVIEDNKLTAAADTRYGKFTITGNRI